MAELIDVVDRNGNRTRVDAARLRRWPSLAAEFRPVSDEAAPAAVETPAGDKEEEA